MVTIFYYRFGYEDSLLSKEKLYLKCDPWVKKLTGLFLHCIVLHRVKLQLWKISSQGATNVCGKPILQYFIAVL